MQAPQFHAALFNGPINGANDVTRRQVPGMLNPWLGHRAINRRVTTGSGGFGSFTCIYPCTRYEAGAWEMYIGHHVHGWLSGKTVFEGRLEIPKPVQNGLELTAIGYISSLADLGMKYSAAAGVDASTLAQEALRSYLPLLSPDSSLITTTGHRLEATEYDGSESVLDVLQGVLGASAERNPRPFEIMVLHDRRLALRGREVSYVSWRIPWRSLDEEPMIPSDLQEMFTSIKVRYEATEQTATGGSQNQAKVYGPVDNTQYLERLKFRREITVTGAKAGTNQSGDEQSPEQIAQTEMKRLSNGMQPFNVIVSGPVYNVVGAESYPGFIRTGELIALDTGPGDERQGFDAYNVFYVNGTDYNVETGVQTISAEPVPSRLLTLVRVSGVADGTMNEAPTPGTALVERG